MLTSQNVMILLDHTLAPVKYDISAMVPKTVLSVQVLIIIIEICFDLIITKILTNVTLET